jgi:hypothetical protein
MITHPTTSTPSFTPSHHLCPRGRRNNLFKRVLG